MYANPAHVKKHAIKVSLNDEANELIHAQAQFRGEQPAVFTRRLVEEGMKAMGLVHERNSSGNRSEMRGANQSLSMA